MNTKIKDSGHHQQFYDKDGNELAVRDMDLTKPRIVLMPLTEIAGIIDDHVFSIVDEIINTKDVEGKIKATQDVIEVLQRLRGWNNYEMLYEVGQHFTDGCEKYGDNNWTKGMPTLNFINSGLRHYIKWQQFMEHAKDGEMFDPNDERHDRAMLWNFICLKWMLIHKPELDDTDTMKK